MRLTPAGQKQYDLLIANPDFVDVRLVKLWDVKAQSNQGSVVLNVPGGLPDWVATPGTEQEEPGNDFVWHGQFNGGACNIHVDHTGTYGNIRVPNRAFHIVNLSSSETALVELDPEYVQNVDCGLSQTSVGEDHGIGESIPSFEGSKKRQACDRDIDILFLYTNNAEQTGLSPSSVANSVKSQLYNARRNSGLSYNDISFHNVGVVKLKGFVESSNIFTDRNNLAANSWVNNLRASYSADIVILLTDGNYTINGSPIYGVAFIEASVDYAFCIAEIQAATMDHTAAHEIGHVMGGRHENDNSSYYARAHIVSAYHATIMATGSVANTHTIIPHFSNPSVNYIPPPNPPIMHPPEGWPTGVSGSRDVALKLKNRACTVSDFSENLSARLQMEQTTIIALDRSAHKNPELTYQEDKLVPTESRRQIAHNLQGSVDSQIFHIYPNPTTGDLRIEGKVMVTGELLNLTGQKIQDITVSDDLIDLKGIPPGTYLLRIRSGKDLFVWRIIRS